MHDPFSGNRFMIRQQVFTFPHRKFQVYDAMGTMVLFCKMRGFKLREDIRLYADEAMTQELITISSRQIIDFSAAYDVIDAVTHERIGVLQRRGFTSMIRDSWEILTPDERPLGNVVEDSMLKALVRRFVDMASWIMPQSFHVDVAGARVATFKQNFNPFVRKLDIDFHPDAPLPLAPKLGLATAILMMAIEGRQD